MGSSSFIFGDSKSQRKNWSLATLGVLKGNLKTFYNKRYSFNIHKSSKYKYKFHLMPIIEDNEALVFD